MKKKLTLSMDPELTKKAKIQALKEDMSLSAKVADLLQAWLQKPASDKPSPP